MSHDFHGRISRDETYKLHIQVAEVVIEMALERMERLKISDGRTHPIGAIFASAGFTFSSEAGKQTERVRKVDIINVDERDSGPSSRSMVDQIRPISPDNAAHDDQRNTSPRGTGHE